MEGEPSLLEELKRRKVVRAALVYAAAAFAVLEFANIAFPRLGFPDGWVNAMLWIALAGFPLTIALAWTLDLREETAGGPARAAGRLSFPAVATAVVLVALGVATGTWWAGDQAEPPSKGDAPLPRGPSLAVRVWTTPGEFLARSADGNVAVCDQVELQQLVVGPKHVVHVLP